MSDKPKLHIPTVGTNGMNQLHASAHAGDFERLKDCLQKGDDPNAVDSQGWAALHWLADMALTIDSQTVAQIAETLIDAGADTNLQAIDGSTPLLRACLCGDDELIVKFLENGADPKIRAKDTTCLHLVLYSPDLVKLLIEYDAPLDETDDENQTALEKAKVLLSQSCEQQVLNILSEEARKLTTKL